MAVIGFSFTKLHGERKKGGAKGSIEINHGVKVLNVEKTSINVGSGKNDVLRVDFEFSITYGNSLGKISIEGDVIFSDTKEIVDETLKSWSGNKKLPISINEEIHKFIYSKSIVKGLEMSDNLNLPAPIPLMPKNMFAPKKAADKK